MMIVGVLLKTNGLSVDFEIFEDGNLLGEVSLLYLCYFLSIFLLLFFLPLDRWQVGLKHE